MDHDVSLYLASICSAALVVAELLVRVHTASLLLLTLDTSKGASRPASFSTHPSSTVAWGATEKRMLAIYPAFRLSPWSKKEDRQHDRV